MSSTWRRNTKKIEKTATRVAVFNLCDVSHIFNFQTCLENSLVQRALHFLIWHACSKSNTSREKSRREGVRSNCVANGDWFSAAAGCQIYFSSLSIISQWPFCLPFMRRIRSIFSLLICFWTAEGTIWRISLNCSLVILGFALISSKTSSVLWPLLWPPFGLFLWPPFWPFSLTTFWPISQSSRRRDLLFYFLLLFQFVFENGTLDDLLDLVCSYAQRTIGLSGISNSSISCWRFVTCSK